MNSRSSEQESPSSKLDPLDRKLISELRGDARMAYALLGTRLGVTGMTAANRLQRLRQADLLKFRVVPNFDAYKLTTHVLGLVQADVGVHGVCIELLTASPYVLRVERVTGEYDLSFSAVFPSEVAMGGLVRELQSLVGVRRLVVHHCLETIKNDDGWSAVLAEPGPVEEDAAFEVAAGVRVPDHLRTKVATAALWLNAMVNGDTEQIATLSTPDVIYTIMPPQIAAGTYDGLESVAAETRVAGKVWRHLWHRIISVAESQDPYDVIIDSINTAERRKGEVRTAFARMAFGFVDGRVRRVVSLGQMDLPELPATPAADAQGNRAR